MNPLVSAAKCMLFGAGGKTRRMLISCLKQYPMELPNQYVVSYFLPSLFSISDRPSQVLESCPCISGGLYHRDEAIRIVSSHGAGTSLRIR